MKRLMRWKGGAIRKVDYEGGPKAFFAFHLNLTAVLVYDFFNDGQPEACADHVFDI